MRNKETIINIAFSGETLFALTNQGRIYKYLNGAWVLFDEGEIK